jgi:hypothetical protein
MSRSVVGRILRRLTLASGKEATKRLALIDTSLLFFVIVLRSILPKN